MYLMRQELVWGAMFKGQDSHMGLKAVSSGAEMAVDRPSAVPLLLCCRSMLAKLFNRDLEVCPTYIFEHLE